MNSDNSPATARLTVMKGSAERADVIVSKITGELIECEAAVEWSKIEGLAQVAARELKIALRNTPKRPDWPEEVGQATLDRLRSVGTLIMTKMLGIYRSVPPKLGAGTLDDTPLLSVDVVCPSTIVLPVELFPMLDAVPGVYGGWDEIAAGMVGFGAEVQRSMPTNSFPGTLGPVDPSSIAFYWNAGLTGARKEHDRLREWFGDGFIGPNPKAGATPTALARGIVEPPGREDEGGIAVAIEHFSCHHKRAKKSLNPDVVVLRRKGMFVRVVSVSADDITKSSLGRAPKPGLVFLNACGTQVVNPRAVSSFVSELHDLGRDTIIGTWCDVPDEVAAEFGRLFYQAMLQEGATAGSALRRARIRLLREFNNPLGLLYTLYGNPLLRLTS